MPPAVTAPSLAADLRVALSRANRRVRAERGSAGLSDPQFSVLALLTRNGPMTPGQLADADRVQPPTMTRTVNCLVDLGLVSKGENPADGRQVVVSLTEQGVAEVRETRRRRNAWLAQRLAGLTAEERAVLSRAAELLRGIAEQ
ncbi:MAG: MarR family transcriptional regulator [Cellulomonas sp. 73-145]|uniref:MarR family winged helix-turn-helix transcriptional regulator n=1 Tax=unclassified Cellulomonas TaxID=2620175 RepID=UPI0009259799|nr:MarR family transcriptional regulator [Cellulomonas sp. 73-145]MBN9326427.1 MarR family transcriptional regulator [Cellulomonas sp.]OJV57164.1 MAG: MarR family transcriptional regulator [Cellulomonas sp. 73-145]BDO41070.1 MarR family transcriptional regulator [Cellulomonas sp. NTE-D12]